MNNKYSTIYLFKIFILIGFIQFLIDFTTNDKLKKCLTKLTFLEKNQITYFLLLHHIIISFIQYSWIVNDKIVLLFRLILFFILFSVLYLTDNNCPITSYIAKRCNDDQQFRDLLYIVGAKKNPERLKKTEIILYSMLTIINIYKLIK